VLALLALGHHLEGSDADYASAASAYEQALAVSRQIGDVPTEAELHAAIARLALYRADWPELERACDASAELSEREGLIGKLCLPFALRGRLHWRSGSWQESEQAFRRSHELAIQIGWSEVVFDALFGLATTLRDQGEAGAADEALTEALEACERAGLIVESIQAHSARALLYAQSGRLEPAREAAAAAEQIAADVHYPVGKAAALEAAGVTSADVDEGIAALAQARSGWETLGRPLDAARNLLLLGQLQLRADPTAATQTLERAAQDYDAIGVAHLALRARTLARPAAVTDGVPGS
jgi:tetratricopeptide (TPR) repeat protein